MCKSQPNLNWNSKSKKWEKKKRKKEKENKKAIRIGPNSPVLGPVSHSFSRTAYLFRGHGRWNAGPLGRSQSRPHFSSITPARGAHIVSRSQDTLALGVIPFSLSRWPTGRSYHITLARSLAHFLSWLMRGPPWDYVFPNHPQNSRGSSCSPVSIVEVVAGTRATFLGL
jgi:hypothetical protein